MRISSGMARIATGGTVAALVGGLCIGLGLGFGLPGAIGSGLGLLLQPALAFDGTATPSNASLTPSAGIARAAPPRKRPMTARRPRH